MAMSNKLVAVFLVCIAMIAAMHVHQADARQSEADDDVEARFKECFKNCLGECTNNDHGYNYCEMECDSGCGAKEAEAKLGIDFRNGFKKDD